MMIEKILLDSNLFEKISVGIAIADDEANITLINRAFSVFTGYTAEESLGRTLLFFLPKPPEDLAAHPFPTDWHGEIVGLRKDGTGFVAWLHVGVVVGHGECSRHRVAILNDMTALREAEARLAYFSHHDQLTSLPARNIFLDRLEQALAHALRRGDMVGLFLVDVDRFKGINDTFGFAVGSRVLQEIARRLVSAVRRDDTVARLGDDEFAVIAGEIAEPGQALTIAEKLSGALSAPFLISENGQEVFIGTSIGVVLYPQDGETTVALLQNVDSALDHVKNNGRGSFQFFALPMREKLQERAHIENELHHALDRGELELYYQPKVSLVTGRIVGLEALARWNHSRLGLVGPDRFIPVAEESGLIIPIGAWALESACRQAARWRDAGMAIPVAVNVSAHQLYNSNVIGTVEQALSAAALEPELLELEITESALMRNAERSQKVLRELHGLGLRLSVDDFGTGYSSLAYLKAFPLSEIKIDRSFVNGVADDSGDRAIVAAVIALARALDLATIAEGVETQAQREEVVKLGCDAYQGYLCSRPLPAADTTDMLLKNRKV